MKKDLSKESLRQERIYLVIGMLFVFLFYSFFSLRKLPLHTSSDELGTIAGAAFFAGRDWSGVINGCGYYGMGYYILFAPLFWLTDNPVVLYRTILIFNGLLKVLIVWIAFQIFSEFVVIKNARIKILIAVLCTLMYSTRISSISNEYILEALLWLVLYFCCKIIQNNRRIVQKNIYSFLLLICLGSGLLIHTRWATVIIAIAITFCILFVIYKKKFFPLWQIFLFVILYFAINKIIALYQSFIWDVEGTLRNSSVTIEKGIRLLDISTWKLWINIVIGNFGAMTIFTGGLFIIAVAIFVYVILCSIKKKETPEVFWGTINISMVLCIGATIAGLLVSSWFSGMFPSYSEGKVGLNIYAYKGLTYLRYWEIYIPPVVGCALAVLCEKRIYLPIARIAAILTCIVLFLFIMMVLPLIENNQSALEPLYGLGFFQDGDKVDINNYLCSISVLLTIEFITLLCLWKDRVVATIVIFICFFFFQYGYATINYDNNVMKRMNSMVNASTSLFQECIEKNISFGNIYGLSNENRDNNWKICYILQFYFNREMIISEVPEQFGKNDLVITNVEEIMTDFPEAKPIQIDDNEYWFVFNEENYRNIKEILVNENQ